MKKLFVTGMVLVVFLAMLTTSCHKDETNNNGNNGDSGSGDHVIPNAVSDIDGNSYDAVQIGNQVWMAENLRTTRNADGTSIPMGTSASATTAYRYAPGPNQSNDENLTNIPRYGYLYNWPAVMHGASNSESNPSVVRGICPIGWHVPSDAEWIQLFNYVSSQTQFQCNGSSQNIDKALASPTGWFSSNITCAVGNDPSSNNATGFSALPAGYYGGGYGYGSFGSGAYFWSATDYSGYDAYNYDLYYESASVNSSLFSDGYRSMGFSVRCVRD